jgi:hypothetical protein
LRPHLLLVLAPLLAAEDIKFSTLPQGDLERRLQSAHATNSARAEELKRAFSAAGCPSVEEQSFHKSKPPNIICRFPGSSQHAIVVGAHYDFTGKGSAGVVDNWTGAALLPALFLSLKGEPRRHEMIFVGFSAEEEGLLGSKAFVKQLGKAGLERIRAMVNLDSLGLTDSKVAGSQSDKDLLLRLAEVAQSTELPLGRVDVDKVGLSDGLSFRQKKVKTIELHSITQETWPVLHSPRDQIQAVHLESYYRTYRLITVYLAYLDSKLDTPD